MMFLAENLKRYRMMKNMTQEDIADYLNVTPQSVSKWERGESYPDITFLPALANIFETSIDLLIGLDIIRSEETRMNIHKTAVEYQRNGDYQAAEKVYRDALRIYPNKPGMILGLGTVLALQNRTQEAIEWMERGLPISINEKHKATVRAVLCFLYLKCGNQKKATQLAATLPHRRECREEILPLITKGLEKEEIDINVRKIIIGEQDKS